MHSIHSKQGFTLAEVLIALALLGIVAAFTIPQIMQVLDIQQTQAKLRETVATLESAFHESHLNGDYSAYFYTPDNSIYFVSLYHGLQDRLNTLEKSANPIAAGHPCSSRLAEGFAVHPLYGYVVLPNKVLVTGMYSEGDSYNSAAFDMMVRSGVDAPNAVLCIDINNRQGPNAFGQDIFLGNFNLWGDFDRGTGTQYLAHKGGKKFHWGNASQPVYAASGGALAPAYNLPEYRVGTYLK